MNVATHASVSPFSSTFPSKTIDLSVASPFFNRLTVIDSGLVDSESSLSTHFLVTFNSVFSGFNSFITLHEFPVHDGLLLVYPFIVSNSFIE